MPYPIHFRHQVRYVRLRFFRVKKQNLPVKNVHINKGQELSWREAVSFLAYLFQNIGDHSDLIQITYALCTLKDVGKLGENCIYSLKKLGEGSNRFVIFKRDFTQFFFNLNLYISLSLCKPFLLLKKQVCVFN